MKRLGDILVAEGVLTSEQLDSAFDGKPRGRMLGDWLVDKKLLSTAQLGMALAKQFEVDYVDIDPAQINPQIARLIPEAFARDRMASAIDIQDRSLTLAMVAPDDIETIAEVELMTGYLVNPAVAMGDDITVFMNRAYDERATARQTIVDLRLEELRQTSGDEVTGNENTNDDDDAPVVRLVHSILTGAITAGASDIHLEPHKPEMRVRYRVDGELQPVMTIPNYIEESIVSRIKVMADMDTTETRRPQDGHLTVSDDGKRFGFRVSGIPTVDGQKLVLRLIDESGKTFLLDSIGLTPRDRESLNEILDKPHGMFVVTGPTGSGKSTTLYAALQHLNSDDRNIVTVEDPVENRIAGINQVQSDNEFGMGFANALKFIMRQDPDVIMVGEIRDSETAGIAVQAALTGHLMISTLHTNDAVGAITRLSDLGVDHFKIAGSLLGSVAQRLLRCICEHCKVASPPNPSLLRELDPEDRISSDVQFYHGQGCKRCLGSGYSGRIPIFEIMPMTTDLTVAIERGMPQSHLRELAIQAGMIELRQAGLEQAIAGKTSLQEVYFKTSGDRRRGESGEGHPERRESD
ncbi:MAG: ATPase, T2SS/T4P/T4SS family [Planctomycetota bacterium]